MSFIDQLSPVQTSWTFYTQSGSGYGARFTIDPVGHILPGSVSTQNIGNSSIRWSSVYLGGAIPFHLDRTARTANQSWVFSIAGSESGTGTWTMGMQPNSTESSFHITHAGTNRIVLSENGQVDFSGPALNALSATASFNIVNAVGNPAYRVGGITIVDSSRNASFVNLTLSGTCTGCPAGSPPIDWWLDSGSAVETLGNHGTVSALQLLAKFSRGTHAAPSDAADGDQVFGLKMQYYAGGAYRDAAAIFGYSTATPSASSSPGKLSFFVTPTGSTAGVERFYIDDTESWFHSSMPGDWPLHIRNTSTSGYSGLMVYNDNAAKSGMFSWNNAASSINPGYLNIGTHSADSIAIITTDTARWYIASGDGSITPATDGGPSFGGFFAKPNVVWSRQFYSYTDSSWGTQQNTLEAEGNLNLYLVSIANTASTDRASIQMHRYRGSHASPMTVVNGDRVGNIAWQAYANGSLAAVAVIEAYINGTVSTGIAPTEIRYRTQNASGSLADRWIMQASGNLIPAADDTYSIGIGGQRPQSVVAMELYAYRSLSFIGSTGRLASNMLPDSDATRDLGSLSVRYNRLYSIDTFTTNSTAETGLFVITSGVTRFSASGGGLNLYTSGGANTFSVATSSGNTFTTGFVSAGSGFVAAGNTGVSVSLSCPGGQAIKTLTAVLGIITGATCGVP